MEKLTCIIPFYNESDNIFRVIKEVDNVKQIGEIIVIDDGSTYQDNYQLIKNNYKFVKIVRLKTNRGKAGAVRTGLKIANFNTILMLDADYVNLNHLEIDKIVSLFFQHKLDMLLVRVTGGNNILDKLLRKEILFSGFRVLKTKDLFSAFKHKVSGYELEVAINEYMLINNKRVFWTSSKALNIHKLHKWGYWKGITKSFYMELSILKYLGVKKFLRQVLSFATYNINC